MHVKEDNNDGMRYQFHERKHYTKAFIINRVLSKSIDEAIKYFGL